MTGVAPTGYHADLSVLASSPLVRSGGVVVSRLVSAGFVDDLRMEAYAQHPAAREALLRLGQSRDGERGAPDRWLEIATGGVALHAFIHSQTVLDYLHRLTALDWTPLGDQGAYSYYRRPGHYLGLHRDIVNCDLTVITCIARRGQGTGGVLLTYPARCRESIEGLRRSPYRGARGVMLQVGESAILLGGTVPHQLTPLDGTQIRVVAPICYRLATLR